MLCCHCDQGRSVIVPSRPPTGPTRTKQALRRSFFVPDKVSTMKAMIGNWRTSAAGIWIILGALADLTHQAATGTWDGNRLLADWTAGVGGVGLLCARDEGAK